MPRSGSDPKPRSRAPAAAIALAVAYAALYSFLCAQKYRYYLYRDFDLAIFAQAMEQMLHGSLFSSIRGMAWLGDHASWILFPLLPVYAVFRHPVTLLVVQSAALGIGAYPVFAVARRLLRDDTAALGFAIAYLLHPAVGYSNLFEFHPETLATPALLFTWHYLLQGRLTPTLVAAGLAAMCREDVALVLLGMAAWALWERTARAPRLAAGLAGLAALSLAVSFGVLRTAFNHGEAGYGYMYTDWGSSSGQVVANVLRHPLRAAAALVQAPGDPQESTIKQQYHVLMLAPLLFLPLLSPATLALALPILLEHFLSWRTAQHTIVRQYTALVTPVLVVAAMLGARNVIMVIGRRSEATRVEPTRPARGATRRRRGTPSSDGTSPLAARAIAGAVAIASLFCSMLYGPFGRGRPAQPPESNTPSAADRMLRPYRDRMLAKLPRDGAVVAGFEFLSHLARRADVHAAHHVFRGRYTFSTRPYPIPEKIAAMLADAADPSLANYVDSTTSARLRELIDRSPLACADAVGDLLLLTRAGSDSLSLVGPAARAAEDSARVTFDRRLIYLGSDRLVDHASPGSVVELASHWRRIAETDGGCYMVLALFDAAGNAVWRQVRLLGYVTAPIPFWPKDRAMAERYRLLLPSTLQPGRYTLAATLSWVRGAHSADAVPDDPVIRAAGGFLTLGTLEISP